MRFTPIDPPREFQTGFGPPVRLKDCGRIELAPDEMVTFVSDSGAQYDLTRKSWGYYATPSLNRRLVEFGLRAVLVRNRLNRHFVLLVERGQEPAFERYVGDELLTIVSWLDSDEALGRLTGAGVPNAAGLLRCPCASGRYARVFSYDEPPAGEVRFSFSEGQTYRREVVCCETCGHFLSIHKMDTRGLYDGAYVNATYSADGLRRAFDRIVALPAEKSDNAGRVRRIKEFAAQRLEAPTRERRAPRVLDVGSGLCVFLYRMKAEGWEGTALDPDPHAAVHAREVVGVPAICGDFMTVETTARFDLVTLNKVLEHVIDPRDMLARARSLLLPHGMVYVEVPDGEAAVVDGPGREEFFIEHHHVFSFSSISLLLQKAGFQALTVERLREPSTKYTLRAFAALRQGAESH